MSQPREATTPAEVAYTRLGDYFPRVFRLGFGGSQIASWSTRHSPREIRSTIELAVAEGVNLFDTADVYGQGDSERLLGKVLRAHRDETIICTKVGLTVSSPPNLVRLVKPVMRVVGRHWRRSQRNMETTRRHLQSHCFEPGYLARALEGSLRRLNVEQIDIVMLHNPTQETLRQAEAMETLEAYRRRGDVTAVGVSLDDPKAALLALEDDRLDCIQVPFNRRTEDSMAPVIESAVAKNVGLILREPFAGGMPAGNLENSGVEGPSRHAQALDSSLRRVREGVVLAGMTCRKHLRENVSVLRRLASGQPTRDGGTGPYPGTFK